MTKMTLIASLAAVCLSGVAMAQTASQPSPVAPAPAAAVAPAKHDDAARGKFRAACGADIAKLCGDVKPVANATPEQIKENRSKMRACLTTNSAKLSADCKSVMTEREAAAAAKKS